MNDTYFAGEVQNLDKLVRKCLVDAFRQTDEDFLKKASSQWVDGFLCAFHVYSKSDDVSVGHDFKL